MKLASFFLAFFAWTSGVFADVVQINGQSEFDKLVKKSDFVVAAFTAPWCGHCKKLKPEFDKAAETLTDEGVILVNVDSTAKENEGLAKKYKISGYPTLFMFRGGNIDKPIEYEGPREAKGIVSYLRRQNGPASTLADAPRARQLMAAETSILGVFPGGDKSKEYTTFMEAATALRAETDLFHTFDAEHLGDHCAEDACKNGRIFVFKAFDEPVMSIDAKGAKKDKIEQFVAEALTPKVVELNQEPKFKKALSKIFDDRTKAKALVFVQAKDKPAFRSAIAAAQDKITDVHFVMVVGADNQGALNFFGIAAEDFPAIAIHQQSPTDAKFVRKDAKAADVEAFVADFLPGKVEKHIKSEPIPEDNSEPVKVIVAKNFDDMVFKSGKDVLLEAYAPWCGHCKKLAPIYDAVAEHYASDAGIMIAKIDATANDILTDRMDVKGFPTLYFYKHATDEVIKYEADRTEEAFYEFIEKNRSGTASGEKKDEL